MGGAENCGLGDNSEVSPSPVTGKGIAASTDGA